MTTSEPKNDSIVNRIYNKSVRNFLPEKVGVFNGVAIREPRLFDSQDHWPGYKADFVQTVRQEVQTGDEITIVGAGHGVSSVVAARQTTEEGQVTIYEASPEWVQKLPETMELNCIPEGRYQLKHALVGDAIDVDGDFSNAAHIPATEMELGDILELDCEGAELGILESLTPSATPETVIVETHPTLGSPSGDIRNALQDLGLRVEKTGEDPVAGDILVGRSD